MLVDNATTTGAGPQARSGSVRPRRQARWTSLVCGFWLIVVALLGARVALFEEITAARFADAVLTQVASLSTVLQR